MVLCASLCVRQIKFDLLIKVFILNHTPAVPKQHSLSCTLGVFWIYFGKHDLHIQALHTHRINLQAAEKWI